MDLIEFNTHSFIVKIWLEEPTDDNHKGKWRGHITHVPGGERRYLKNLGEILAFIVPYLMSMGLRPDALWKLKSLFGGSSRTKLEIEAGEQGGVTDSNGHQSVEG